MKILLFATSLRKASLNKKFIECTCAMLAENSSLGIHKINLEDFDMPMYNGDIEDTQGLPSSVLKLYTLVESSDAVIVSTPEYNGSISGVFKNVLDWTSRKKPNCWEKKSVLLLGASPGALGAVRGLWHTRQPFDVLKARLYPEMMGLQKAAEAFDEQNLLKDIKNREMLRTLLNNFLEYSRRLSEKNQ